MPSLLLVVDVCIILSIDLDVNQFSVFEYKIFVDESIVCMDAVVAFS
jgi:hypothetical protein